MKIILPITLFFLWSSCSCSSEEKNIDPVEKSNITVTISEDSSLLSKLIDITNIRPQKVKFKYTFIDNSGQNERLAVPGPSDHYLEAILFYDAKLIDSLSKICTSSSIQLPEVNLGFDWDEETQHIIQKKNSNLKSYSDCFFKTGPKSKIWFLDDRIVLVKSS